MEESKKPEPGETTPKTPGLLKKERDFVVPGDRIVDGMEFLPGKNCFRDGNSIYVKRVGIVSVRGRVVSVIALNSVYTPKTDDMVIGEVTEIRDNGWVVEIKSPYHALLPLSQVSEYVDPAKGDMARIYNIGDMLYCRISQVTTAKRIDVSMLDRRTRKFHGGRILEVNPAKVPRIIGKLGSMINMIKDKTGCIIIAGQNGLIWLMGEKDVQDLAINAIRTIEKEAHKDGLTDRIGAMLEKAKGAGKPAAKAEPAKTEPAKAPEKEPARAMEKPKEVKK